MNPFNMNETEHLIPPQYTFRKSRLNSFSLLSKSVLCSPQGCGKSSQNVFSFLSHSLPFLHSVPQQGSGRELGKCQHPGFREAPLAPLPKWNIHPRGCTVLGFSLRQKRRATTERASREDWGPSSMWASLWGGDTGDNSKRTAHKEAGGHRSWLASRRQAYSMPVAPGSL